MHIGQNTINIQLFQKYQYLNVSYFSWMINIMQVYECLISINIYLSYLCKGLKLKTMIRQNCVLIFSLSCFSVVFAKQKKNVTTRLHVLPNKIMFDCFFFQVVFCFCFFQKAFQFNLFFFFLCFFICYRNIMTLCIRQVAEHFQMVDSRFLFEQKCVIPNWQHLIVTKPF